MKVAWWAACVFTGVAGFTASPPQQPDLTLVFTGDIGGYLSPCGCTKPQIGGMRRMAGVIRALTKQPNTYYVDIGNWSKPGGRQDQLKAEALAELYRNLGADYVNIGGDDVLHGEAFLQALHDASGGTMGSANLLLPWAQQTKQLGKSFVVGVVSGDGPLRIRSASEAAMAQTPLGTSKIVLVSGDREQAKQIAENTDASLIIHSLHGDPASQPEQAGNATLVTAGDHGRYVGKIELRNRRWSNFALIQLGPEHQDDAAASRIYTAYLKRVTSENLIADVPRSSDIRKFIGSKNCAPCHTRTYQHWKTTAHSHALLTLEKTGNDKDPECVGCHVIALDHTTGFRDKRKTPALANVGCESCHGAGYAHAKKPRIIKLGAAGEKSCVGCHNAENSPTFNFSEYWRKIRH